MLFKKCYNLEEIDKFIKNVTKSMLNILTKKVDEKRYRAKEIY